MSWRCPIARMALSLMVAGCTVESSYLDPEATGIAGKGLVAHLVIEAEAIMRLLGFGQVLIVLLIALAGWAAARVVHGGVLLAWRMGMDARRRLAFVLSAVQLLIVGAVAYLLLRRFLVAAPILTLLALGLSVSASLLVLAHRLQNTWAGFVLSFRRRLREGDRVAVADQIGIVREVGITRMHLRCADGAAIFVPNRVFLREAVRVEKAQNSVPVVVRVRAPTDDISPDVMQSVRRSSLLCPFRAPGTTVEVELSGDAHVRVVVQVWSDRAVQEARRQVEMQVRAVLARSVGGGNNVDAQNDRSHRS